MKTDNLIINEIFYSIQGESTFSGIPTVFIRLTGCPLRCQYCDTSYAFTEGIKMTFNEILNEVNKYNCDFITVTGGEPLAQKNTNNLLNKLVKKFNVSLETSNALSIKDVNKNVNIVLDIKTPGSGEVDKNLTGNYEYLTKNHQLKFVICNNSDYVWSKNYIYEYELHKRCEILFSPSNEEMNIKVLAEKILEDHIPARLQVQLHKIIWNDQRGK